jgi:hypothetical protein
MVILDGNALGLMIISGEMPCSVNGISFCGHKNDITPFCPCRLENLSPVTGFLGNLSLILAEEHSAFSGAEVMQTDSINADSEDL